MITGASSGIGRAASQLFAREGATVVVADIDEAGGQETLELIREASGNATFVRTDVSEAADVERLVEEIVDRHGRLDCAYNNAGVLGQILPLTDHEEDHWNRVLDTNLKGTWLCMKYQIPQMRKQGGGVIVNTTATAGIKGGSPLRSAYAASKAGIVTISKAAAMENAEHGLRINVICPSHTRSPMLQQFFDLRPDLEADFIAQAPMGRIAAAEEVAEGALWLCSDASSFTTGHVLAVDGGFLAR